MYQSLKVKQKEKKLIEDVESGDFFLSSPKQTYLGKGTFAEVDASKDCSLVENVRTTLERVMKEGHPSPVVAGAIPFDSSAAHRLRIPEEWHQSDDTNGSIEEGSPLVNYELRPHPAPLVYKEGVRQGLASIEKGELSKIVLSRSLVLTSSEKINRLQLLKNLEKHNPKGYTFAAPLEGTKERTLIGASPELLVSKRGKQVFSNPLAGSRPRSEDPVEDRRRAEELLDSTKDLHEHAVVVESVSKALEPYCSTLHVPSRPSLIETETMWHLSTEIVGEVKDEQVSSMEMAAALHPTPAVCGQPTAVAQKKIGEIEPFSRGFFTGMVGWNDWKGDGEWIVTIRCAEVDDHSVELYAGAGVVKGSTPEDELNETTAKFQTMLRAMGVES